MIEQRIWLGLLPPEDPNDAERLVRAALAAGKPIDVSSAPARWGGMMRGTHKFLTSFSGYDIENATDPTHAINLVHAELIQTLSGIGREYLDVLFLSVRKKLSAHQLEGAVTALQSAKSEGLVKSCGLFIEGSRDAVDHQLLRQEVFDIFLVPDNPLQNSIRSAVDPVATELAVPLMSCRTLNWRGGVPLTAFSDRSDLAKSVIAQQANKDRVLVGVRSVKEIEQAAEAEEMRVAHNIDQELIRIAQEYQNADAWRALEGDKRSWVREAAKQRLIHA